MNKPLFLFIVLIYSIHGGLFGQAVVEQLFATKCGICHTIGKGKLIGPDLANVQERRSREWLVKFVTSSQSMIKSGDPDAVALFEENNKVIMPDPVISKAEIESVLDYIATKSTDVGGVVEYISIIEGTTDENYENGRRLFDGRKALANGGPSCISCHSGVAGTYFDENSLAKNLSSSFTALGEQGVRAILENPPFPVMTKAFANSKLTAAEVRDLLVFLSRTVPASTAQVSVPSGMLLYGILGGVALLLIYSALWYYRKPRPVNHQVFERQMRSTN